MNFPAQYKSSLLQALDTIDLAKVERLIEAFAKARDEDRQIFICGNGGSAATAAFSGGLGGVGRGHPR